MFYSQINRDVPPVETIHCGLSCFTINLHIPKRSRYSPTSFRAESSGGGCKSRIKSCISYLWTTRLSVQCNYVPCLIILILLASLVTFVCIDRSHGHYFYHQLTTPLLYPSSPAQDAGSPQSPVLDLHHKLSVNYPNAHVIAGPPLSKEDLGHLSWLFLHTQSITFPEEPTEQRSRDMQQFWESFSRLYPCGECGKHMREYLQKHPPETGSRTTYSLWLCRFHNAVSMRVQPDNAEAIYDCDAERLLEKWKPSEYCGCDNEHIEGVDKEKISP